ncbi:MAG TPA: trypsin-like peptidase domain-containing protein, partial [Kofleriaceae bacterium]|nr:trypsin-like peptidase domain-containing protein [Kofleriaceae bacterium]
AASTSMRRPSPIAQHDIGVLIAAMLVLAVGGLVYHELTTPTMTAYEQHGLRFEWPGSWLPGEPLPDRPGRLLADPAPPTAAGATGDELPFHEVYSYAADDHLRVEVRIDRRPAYGNLRGVLSFERHNRFGELYRMLDGKNVGIEGRDWLRTRFQYAWKEDKSDAPETAFGIEYAIVAGDRLYVVTLHGSDAATGWLDHLLAPTLHVSGDSESPVAAPLYGSSASRFKKEVVRQVLPSVVMVMAVDRVRGSLQPVASGSGTIVAADGSVLTNRHVIYDDRGGRLYDLFVIGRFRAPETEPEYVCGGRPNRAKIDEGNDLALIKCDMDMDGQPWAPHDWPKARIDLHETVVLGERIWVLGYPDVGGGMISASTGEVTGTERDSAIIHTTAAITPGSSGGAAIDEQGLLIGVPTAFAPMVNVEGGTVTRLSDVGLIRPIQQAAALLAIAAAGWTPTPGDSAVGTVRRTQPSADELGVMISSQVLDADNDRPVPGAKVLVFKPGVRKEDVDLDSMTDLVLTWARTDASGRFTLPQRLPRALSYSVAVVADGYQPLIASDILVLHDATPSHFDPWGKIRIQR